MNINDPLYIASSYHPGMILTNTPFNGSNFHGWSRNIKMALGAKLKLGFIDGSCIKPASDHDDLQRWIRCDYMVTCWILNSMVTELSDAFLYAQSACELWKEIGERYGQSNGPLVYQLERELSKISQGNLSVASYFNKLKKCWDELHNINGMPTCNCGKMRECTCSVLEKFALSDSNSKLIQFLMKLNDEYESVRSQILAMDPLPTVNKAYYIVQQIEKQKQVTNHVFEPTAFFANMNNKNNSNGRRENNKGNRNEVKGETKNEISFKKICTNCGQEGHLFEQCFERLGYPDWYKGKKAKKNNRLAAHVNSGFDEHFSGETPFDMGYENEVGLGQNGHVDQKLVAAVCQEMMKMFRGRASSEEKRGASSSHAGILSCFTASFALFCHPDMDLLLDWISDSGASDHMSPHLNLFITTKHLKKPIIVHLPDGTSKTVTIVGQVQLTPSLILTDVFYVPDFQLNLLSVGKLIKTRQLAACFYPNDFVFQDLTTNQIVAVGKGSKNLYICKPTLDQTTFDAQVSTFCKTYQNIIPVHCFNKNAFSNYVSKHSVDIKTFHERLAHTSVSKLVHIPQYKHLDVSSFSCECCLLSKHHRLPFQRSNSIAKNPFDLIHVDLWGPFKHPA
ncbi:pyridoxal 5'-phosphate synthase-like subunit PDX1.2 [Tanacetum coccineum]